MRNVRTLAGHMRLSSLISGREATKLCLPRSRCAETLDKEWTLARMPHQHRVLGQLKTSLPSTLLSHQHPECQACQRPSNLHRSEKYTPPKKIDR
jgi:hypothetical protein